MSLPQGDQRILVESRGARRLSSQTLIDLRLSKSVRAEPWVASNCSWMCSTFSIALHEEGLASDNLFSPNFADRRSSLIPGA